MGLTESPPCRRRCHGSVRGRAMDLLSSLLVPHRLRPQLVPVRGGACFNVQNNTTSLRKLSVGRQLPENWPLSHHFFSQW